MQMMIGCEMVGQAETSSVVFAVQIGVTRIGRGGRCLPRTRRGAMTTVAGLIAAEVEPVELETRPNPAPKAAPLARLVAFTALAVVTIVELPSRLWTLAAALGRVAWYALVGRPGRIHRGSVSWRAIWRNEIPAWV